MDGLVYFLTVIYRDPNGGESDDFWNDIGNLALSIRGSWILMGDFNAITSASECSRSGGSHHKRSHFTNWISSLHLIDMGFSGNPFTWARGNHSNTHIQRRLDRVLCNIEVQFQWPNAWVPHLQRVFSDHAPILLNFDQHRNSNYMDRPFRFIAAWLNHPDFRNFCRGQLGQECGIQ